MTVRELRQLLFDCKDQDAVVVVATEIEYGHVKMTKEVRARREGNSLVLGHPDDPTGFISILIG